MSPFQAHDREDYMSKWSVKEKEKPKLQQNKLCIMSIKDMIYNISNLSPPRILSLSLLPPSLSLSLFLSSASHARLYKGEILNGTLQNIRSNISSSDCHSVTGKKRKHKQIRTWRQIKKSLSQVVTTFWIDIFSLFFCLQYFFIHRRCLHRRHHHQLPRQKLNEALISLSRWRKAKRKLIKIEFTSIPIRRILFSWNLFRFFLLAFKRREENKSVGFSFHTLEARVKMKACLQFDILWHCLPASVCVCLSSPIQLIALCLHFLSDQNFRLD